ncbi:MAG: hypothetical protein HQL56_07070 [Magnetococcales bacterium]|nr:hypothetical protein [Magnetococcales bacterium]
MNPSPDNREQRGNLEQTNFLAGRTISIALGRITYTSQDFLSLSQKRVRNGLDGKLPDQEAQP